MAIKAVLFDLDGTLLPMDNERFMKVYFGALAQLFPDADPREFAGHIMASTGAMVRATGPETNEEKFVRDFLPRFNRGSWDQLKPVFDGFYHNCFNALGAHFPPSPGARAAFPRIRAEGYRIALATNPIFPRVATLCRIGWAGFSPEDFELITAYEDSHACKPRAAYYYEVLERMGGLMPEDCLMVGNDFTEDILPAKGVGMKAFFLTDCPIYAKDRADEDLADGQGSWTELLSFLDVRNVLE